MAPNQQRTRASTLQTPVPNRVTNNPGTDRSVVSELTNPSPPGASLNEGADQGLVSSADNENVVAGEIEKDLHGGDGGDSDEEGDECLLHGDAVEERSGTNVESEDGGKPRGFVDLTNSSGGSIGNVIFKNGDVSSTEMDGLLGAGVKIY